MVDIHSHILPEVDDGARSWEMAVHMCHMASQDGIQHMVATPHSNSEYYYDRELLRGMLEELQRRNGGKPQLSLGCDFHLSYENLESAAENPHRFTIEETPYLLVEFSDFSIPPTISAVLEDLMVRGMIPIITHPERNPLLQRRPERVLEWVQAGCPVQVTANSLTGGWGDKPKKVALWLLEREAVHILASDAHNVEGRPPILSGGREVLSRLWGPAVGQALTEDNPGAIIRGAPLPYFPAI